MTGRVPLIIAAALSLLATIIIPAVAASAQTTPNVVISEIHYHPQAVGTSFPDFDDREDTEFIEILNLEQSAVDLGGWCLDRAVDYCFASGTELAPSSTLVIADNATSFDDVYGLTPHGVYSGKLSNSGEQVRLITDTGEVVVDITWETSDPWPVTPDGNGPSLELVSATGDIASPANWAASSTTGGNPGAVPSLISAAPPLVTSHNAAELVPANQAIPVSASAVNTTAMTLVYDVNYGSNQSLAMTQSGPTWQATIPGVGTGALVRYRFEASGPGGTTTSPRVDDVVGWWAAAVASPQPHNVPVLDLYFTPQDWQAIDNNNCIDQCAGAVAFEGQIWTDVVVRRAGSSSLNANKANLRLDFPPGHPFEASFLDGPADELTLDGGHTNNELLREQLSWDLMASIGFPPIRSQHVRAMIGGQLQGLYLLREEQDASWRARHDLDRGLLYKVEGTTDTFGFSGEHEKKEGFDESDADMFTLRSCLNNAGAALRACMTDTMDLPNLVNEIAATAVIRNIDQREFNYFIYRDNTQNMLWRLLPDDLDRTWGVNGGGSQLVNPIVSSEKSYGRCIGTDTTPANEICRAFMRLPEFEAMYNRRLRTLTDEVLADPIWHTDIATASALIGADWNDDEAKWNRTPYTFGAMVSALDGWIDDYIAHQRAGGHDGKVPAGQSAAPVVTISDYRSDPGDGLGYVMITNPSASESVDLSNWTLAGLAEIPVGLVVLPGATVAVSTNDQLFRAAQPSFSGIRAETQGVIAGAATLLRRDGSIAATEGETPPTRLLLNEWNAVSPANTILGGDVTLGTIAGNGGDWFELVVVEDDLDVRGWRLVISDATAGNQEVRDELIFADDPLLADLEGGTIITISESFADDVSFLPAAGDWHINLQANSADQGSYFTDESQSNFSTNNDNWQLSIFDSQGALVFGPAGEGIGTTPGINSSEVGELEVDPSLSVDTLSGYGDGSSSTFGLENEFDATTQDFSAIRFPYQLGDVTCDGFSDLVDVIRIMQFTVSTATAATECPLDDPTGEMYVGAADVDEDMLVTLVDAIFIARCTVSLTNVFCPD